MEFTKEKILFPEDFIRECIEENPERNELREALEEGKADWVLFWLSSKVKELLERAYLTPEFWYKVKVELALYQRGCEIYRRSHS